MSFQFSIIIICRNEAGHIGQALKSVRPLSDDIVVYDSGSTDDTIAIAKQFGVRLFTGDWEGFGKTRQKAAALSRYDWILVVDADEVVSPALASELHALPQPDAGTAYCIRLKNHLGNRHIKWGTWGKDFRLRLYHKQHAGWNDAIVHEKLVAAPGGRTQKLQQPILHYTARNINELSGKMQQYALLTAEQYYRNGKRSTWPKRRLGPAFAFLKSYVLKLGFLDGQSGYRLATVLADYTFLKYKRLHRLWKARR